jgi:hypothetical protein
MADGILAVETLDSDMEMKEWIIKCSHKVQEQHQHLISMTDIVDLLAAAMRNTHPKLALSYNNYLKPIKLEGCRLKLLSDYFADNLMWGDTIKKALHIYQLQNTLYLRLRGASSLYTKDQLMEEKEKFVSLL